MIFTLDDLALIARVVTRCIDSEMSSASEAETLKVLRRKIRKIVLCKLNEGDVQ